MIKCPRCGYSPSGKNRSNPQNKYYWSVPVSIISEHTGFTKDEVHELLKRKFLKDVRLIHTKKGIIELELTKSTTELDTKSFSDMMSDIRIWASAELNLWIPEPNEELHDKE